MLMEIIAFILFFAVVAGVFIFFIFRGSFDAWIDLRTVYKDKVIRKFRRGKFTEDKTHLRSGKDYFPVVDITPEEYKRKPCYNFVSIQPGVFVPMQNLDREVEIKVLVPDPETEGRFKKVMKKTRAFDLIPKIDYNARAFLEAARGEADVIYREKQKLRQLLITIAPLIIAAAIIIIGLLFLFLVSGNLPDSLNCNCNCYANATRGIPIY